MLRTLRSNLDELWDSMDDTRVEGEAVTASLGQLAQQMVEQVVEVREWVEVWQQWLLAALPPGWQLLLGEVQGLLARLVGYERAGLEMVEKALKAQRAEDAKIRRWVKRTEGKLEEMTAVQEALEDYEQRLRRRGGGDGA